MAKPITPAEARKLFERFGVVHPILWDPLHGSAQTHQPVK